MNRCGSVDHETVLAVPGKRAARHDRRSTPAPGPAVPRRTGSPRRAHASTEHSAGKLPVKCAVSTTTARITPGHRAGSGPSRGRGPGGAGSPTRPRSGPCARTCAGGTRRRSARSRFSFSPKNSSLAAITPAPRRRAARFDMRVRHCLVSSLPAGAAPAARPRSQVLRTTPVSVWPAYGVTGCRCSSRAGSTMNRAVSSNATRSASRPRAIAPLPGSPASAAGPFGHPADHVGEAVAAARAPRSTPRAGRAGARRSRPTPPRSLRSPVASGPAGTASGRTRRCRSRPRPARPTAAPGSPRPGSAGST